MPFTKGILDLHVAFTWAPELERAKVDGPDPLIDFLQAHVCVRRDRGDIDPVVIPPNAPVGADVADLEAIGILQGRERLGHRPWGGRIDRGGRLEIERFMRAFVVKLGPEPIEPALLRAQAPGRGARGFGFERAMHAFMPAILLGLARLDELGQNAQAHPPGGELPEARQGVSGERHAIIGADARGEPELAEQPGEDRFRVVDGGGGQGLTAEQIATEAVGDGQRIAIPGVTRLKVAFEVCAPDVIGREDLVRGFAGMTDVPAPAWRGD